MTALALRLREIIFRPSRVGPSPDHLVILMKSTHSSEATAVWCDHPKHPGISEANLGGMATPNTRAFLVYHKSTKCLYVCLCVYLCVAKLLQDYCSL